MKGLAHTLMFEIAALDNLKFEHEITPALETLAERLIDRFNPDARPSVSMVTEIVVDELNRISNDQQTNPQRHFEIMAGRIQNYFGVLDANAPKPLIGLPSNPFKPNEVQG